MRALVNVRVGGPEVLEVHERPTPDPRGDEVLVEIHRAGLNFADIAARVGLYPDAPRFPAVLGFELSGTVAAVGPEVRNFVTGQRVVAMLRHGAQASHAVVPERYLSVLPDGLSFDDGAALPVTYLTAYHALFHVAPLFPGMTVLIHMAAGGVGLAAIQLARTVDGVTLIGTSSAAKHDFLRAAGLDHPIDYRTHDYVAEVRRLTEGHGVHRVLDALGGPDWAKSYSLLRPTGHLVCFGWANMVDGERRNLFTVVSQALRLPRFSPMRLMGENRSVSGVNMGHLWGELPLMKRHLATLLGLAEAGRIRPHVDSVIPLSRAAEAHRRLQDRKNVGKVLLDCTR